MMYSQEKIETVLPHRAPFLFAREVEVIEAGKLGRATVQLTAVDNYWQGEAGLAPQQSADVLLLESAAQVFGVILASGVEAELAASGKKPADGKHLLLGFDNCDIAGDLYAQPELQLDVALDGGFGSMFKGSFKATTGERLLARGELIVMQGEA